MVEYRRKLVTILLLCFIAAACAQGKNVSMIIVNIVVHICMIYLISGGIFIEVGEAFKNTIAGSSLQ